MKIVSIALLFLCPLLVIGQAPNNIITENGRFLEDLNGNPISSKGPSYESDGTPYFNQDYCNATIKVIRGKVYNGLKAKLNLLENSLLYRIGEGPEMEAVTPIEYILFNSCGPKGQTVMFKSGFPAVDRQTPKSYYQVLDTGRVQLLKYTEVTYMDQKPYGTSTVTRKFDNSVTYYAYTPEKGMIKLGKGNELATRIFADREKEADRFASSQNLKLRREDDLVRLFAFYNSHP